MVTLTEKWPNYLEVLVAKKEDAGWTFNMQPMRQPCPDLEGSPAKERWETPGIKSHDTQPRTPQARRGKAAAQRPGQFGIQEPASKKDGCVTEDGP